MRDFHVVALEDELYERRTLVRMLGMRRTLWVVPRDLVAVVEAACTRTIAARERRRLEGFVETERVSRDPAAWLDDRRRGARCAASRRAARRSRRISPAADPLLATKLTLGRPGTRWATEVGAGARILALLAAEGKLVRGRPRGGWTHGQYRWATREAWLGGEPGELDPAAAQAELLRRWLAAFGPATETDIRWWAGWTAREARAALAAVPHEQVELDDATGYVLADDVEPTPPPEPWVALLPTLDPTTMGWKRRDWYVGPHERVLFDRNGNAGPTVWCGRPRRRRLVAAQGRRDRLRAARGRRRRAACARSRRRPLGSATGSATCGSRRASCPRSSGRSRPDGRGA